METQATEASENSTLLPATNTQTTENLEQSTPLQVTNMDTPETVEHSTPPSATNTETPKTLEQPALPPVTNTQEAEALEQSTEPPPATNTQTTETSEQTAAPCEVTDSHHDNLVPSPENHDTNDMEMRQETAEEEEEVRSILKVIAATGKFWHDWEKLRSMLSVHLKQVLSEYPQAKMTVEEQKSSLGETYAKLAKRLDDALCSFDTGPPFTLQRLAEIILDAQRLYPNLSKLALALEKNLLVTSTLTISSDPYHQPTPNGVEDPNAEQPGPVVENGDEIMADVEADVMKMEVETCDKPAESSSMLTGNP